MAGEARAAPAVRKSREAGPEAAGDRGHGTPGRLCGGGEARAEGAAGPRGGGSGPEQPELRAPPLSSPVLGSGGLPAGATTNRGRAGPASCHSRRSGDSEHLALGSA